MYLRLFDDQTPPIEGINYTEVWKYVQENRGAQQQPLDTAIPLTIINAVIFITGLLGNIAVCIVIRRHPALHTVTNYYLFNLAISDLTLLVFGLPNDVSVYWYQYPWVLGKYFCKLRALISEMSSYASVLTIVAFSSERYLAICHPLSTYTMTGLSRVIKVICCLWTVSFISAFPLCIYTEVHYLNYNVNATTSYLLEESAFCGMLSQPDNFPLIQLSFSFFFVFPLVVILIQYSKMSTEIRKTTERPLGRSVKGSVHTQKERRRAQSNRSVIRMLSAVVICFFVCWAPFHAQRLVIIYGSEWEYLPEFNRWMFFITGIFYYLSSTLNPILYNMMSDKMRLAFREIFCSRTISRNLLRKSTMRETSHTVCLTSAPSAENRNDDIDNDELLTCITPRKENKFIFEIEYKNKKNCDNIKGSNDYHSETRI